VNDMQIPLKQDLLFHSTRGNISIWIENNLDCYVRCDGEFGEVQIMALEQDELLLLYMALGDFFEKLKK